MSKCMTIADESIDQKDTCTEIAPKDIVEFILEEVLLSALIVSDKGCSRIGDFNITEDFCQQYDRHPFLRDFEQVNHTGNPSATNQESNVNSAKGTDRPLSLVTARENLELIIDSFVKNEDKSRPGGECTIISEDVLADNELQIQNGQSHIEKINRGKTFPKAVTREYFDKKDVIRDEKIEIQYYNEGKLSKIYVPLIPFNRLDVETHLGPEKGEERKDVPERREQEGNAENASGQMSCKEDTERPFKPFTAEEFRQVWENINSSMVGRWDGDVSANRKDAITLIEELSSVQVFSDGPVDPTRPRACAFGEEDVKKIIKEIEEISFTQCHANSENFDLACHPDGQGDADLESKSLTLSKGSLEKGLKLDKSEEEVNLSINSDEFRGEESEVFSSEELLMDNGQLSPGKSISNQTLQFSSEKMLTSEGEEWIVPGTENSVAGKSTPRRNSNTHHDVKASAAANVGGEPYRAVEEKPPPNSELCSDKAVKEDGSADQVFDPMYDVDMPTKRTHQTTQNLFGSSYSQSKEDVDNTAKNFLMVQGFRSEYNVENPPSWDTAGGSKQDQLTRKNFELTSERDVTSFQEKLAGTVKTPRSVTDTKDHSKGLNQRPQRSPVSLARLDSSIEDNILKMNSSLGTEFEDNESGSYLQEPDPCSDLHKYDFRMSQNGDDSGGVKKRKIDGLQNVLSSSAKDAMDFGNPEKRLDDVGGDFTEGKQTAAGTSLIFNKTLVSERWSQKSLNEPEESDDTDINVELSTFSPTPSQTKVSSHSLSGSETVGSSEVPQARSQTFKLHSQKIYSGIHHEPDSQAQQEFVLTESEEAFIDMTESVLQIIEPQEYSGDEDSSKVSFLLLCELPQGESSAPADRESESELPLKKNFSSETETTAKRVYSGMTTIGPLKNTENDPKDLSVPDIDFGKMTRIISSRQLAKEIDLFGPELTSTASVKIIEEDSDNDTSLNLEDEHIEFTSLVNRDIASLTKVQKVREVMSHQPKPEDDFEDEDALPRPRLDLKDVESMTDERYKVPEVSIPLLSLEINENNIGAEKELIENMGLVLSGLTNPAYYEDDLEEDSLESQKTPSILDNDYIQVVELSDEHGVTVVDDPNKQASATRVPKRDKHEENQEDENVIMVDNTNSQHDGFSNSPKYGTLGSVFRKASNKFIRRDSDLFLRNSKSLPRETSKINATDSIRSLWDDCQSSASNVLKKSKSLLKTTQSIFKSMSSSRVTFDREPGHGIDKKKISPSESDVSTLERKFSSFIRKEDFAKAKNLLKGKAEKTLKNLDSGSSVILDKFSPQKKDLQVAVIEEDKLRVDRMENFKKLLPKCPLVYKSQFVKSQMSMQKNFTESAEEASDCKVAFSDQYNEQNSNVELDEAELVENERISPEETDIRKQTSSEIEIPSQENPQWSTNKEELSSSANDEAPEPQQPEYIVMETIQGLPTTDLDSPSSEKENAIAITSEQYRRETGSDDDMKKTEASNSFQTCADDVNDVAPCFPEYDDDKMATKAPSERKIKTKKKKLTARFRNFWCSTFGRVKTSSKKCDRS